MSYLFSRRGITHLALIAFQPKLSASKYPVWFGVIAIPLAVLSVR